MSSAYLPGEPIDVCAERIKKNVSIALTGSNPQGEVGTLVLMSILPTDIKDKVALHLKESLSVAEVVATVKTVMPEGKEQKTSVASIMTALNVLLVSVL